MSDETATENPTVDEPVVESEPQGTEDTTDWKAEARKWEKRAKDANSYKEAADKWREYEAAQKPEQERVAEQLAAAKAEAESARTTLMRYEVAAEKKIPAEAVKLLSGSSREELEEAADALLALIAQSKPNTPKPNEMQGKPATGLPAQITNPDDLKSMTPAEVMAAKKDGRLDTLLGKN
ncbi:MAG TPA: hypothetical protein VK149_04370 [Sideroxyarcus sp.]|nr:hypothetical protein [Sideroxyarcus sp.]